MHLLILGSTGKAGQFGLKYALEDGHNVTIIVRDDSEILKHDNLTVIVGSVLKKTDMDREFQALGIPVDAVLQFLNSHRVTSSPWSEFIGPPRLMAGATANATRTLRQQVGSTVGKPRLVVMNALRAGESRHVTPWIMRFIIDHSNVGRTYEDHTAVDAEIERNCGEQIIWTVALAVGLGHAGVKPAKTFSHTEKGAGWVITRESCARLMVDVATGRLDHLYDYRESSFRIKKPMVQSSTRITGTLWTTKQVIGGTQKCMFALYSQ